MLRRLFVFKEKKLLRTTPRRENDTDARWLLIRERMEGINSTGELGGGFLSECPRVQMASLAPRSRLSIIRVTLIDSCSLWLLSGRK